MNLHTTRITNHVAGRPIYLGYLHIPKDHPWFTLRNFPTSLEITFDIAEEHKRTIGFDSVHQQALYKDLDRLLSFALKAQAETIPTPLTPTSDYYIKKSNGAGSYSIMCRSTNTRICMVWWSDKPHLSTSMFPPLPTQAQAQEYIDLFLIALQNKTK